jgi:hypothetical protein
MVWEKGQVTGRKLYGSRRDIDRNRRSANVAKVRDIGRPRRFTAKPS